MQELFTLQGKKCVVMSIDDFYLTGQEQETLATLKKDNPLLQYRGNGRKGYALGML